MTREELIAALETATEPHWTYNGDIVDVLGLEKPDDVPPWQWPPAYTASIDAALTLVPEGCDWVVRSGMADHPTDTRPYAHVMFGNVNRDRSRSLGEAHAPTPALALCIAAIKALKEGT